MRDKKAAAKTQVLYTMSILWVLLLLITFTRNPMTTYASDVDDTKKDTIETFYKGVVNTNVNVRKGPGTSYDKLIVGESSVQLKSGDEVIVIGEDTAADGKIWYQIRFDLNGTTYEGYSTSSYLTKTKDKITPIPTPSPTPTVRPTPTVTPVPSSSEDMSVGGTKSEAEDGGSSILTWVIIGIVFVVAAAVAFVLLKQMRAAKTGKPSSVSKKVDELKHVKLDQGKQGTGQGTGRKKPEIKRLTEDPSVGGNHRHDSNAYVDNRMADIFDGASPYDQGEESLIQENASREAEEKRNMRTEIERLREHDIVIHKYFGEGEVYDNSDVKLLEVRFGNDVRFLNKESLIMKRLLEFVDDEQQILMRRKNSIGRRVSVSSKKDQNKKREE